MATGNPSSLQQFAQLIERDNGWQTHQVELPGLGKTSEILRLPGGRNRVIHVFGTFGSDNPFGTRFFYVILSKDTPELGYLPALSLFEDDPEDRTLHAEVSIEQSVSDKQTLPTSPSEVTGGGALSFVSKQLLAGGRTRIYQITAREDKHACCLLARY